MALSAAGPSGPSSNDGIDLAGKVRNGLGWTFGSQLSLRAASFLTGLILARLLAPHDFGVFAVALAAINLLFSINDGGLPAAVIQHPGDVRRVVPTAFVLSVGWSSLLFGGIYWGAPAFAASMGSPEAAGVVRLICIAVVLDGFTGIPRALLNRNFGHARLAQAELLALPVNVIVAVTLGLLGAGAWSLAWARLAGNLVTGAVIVAAAPEGVRVGFDRREAWALVRFGLPLAATLLIEAVTLNVDNIIVGHALGTVALGFYLLAFNISSWPMILIQATVRRVTIPGFAKLAGDPDALSKAVFRSFGLLAVITIPASLLLGLLASPLVNFLYGPKWADAADAVLWLAVLGGVRVLFGMAWDVLVAVGRPRATLLPQMLWAIPLVPALYLGARLDGIRGAALAQVIVAVLFMAPGFALQFRSAGIALRPLLAAVRRPIMAAFPASVAVITTVRVLEGHLITLLVGGMFAALTYALFAVSWTEIKEATRWLRQAAPARSATV